MACNTPIVATAVGDVANILKDYKNSLCRPDDVYDLAENYPTKDVTLIPGEIVTMDPERGTFVVRSSTPYDDKAIGAISEKPGVQERRFPSDRTLL